MAASSAKAPGRWEAVRKNDGFIAQLAARRKLAQDHAQRIYMPARALLRWGALQTPRHAEPLDLFTADLVLVAATFRLGDFLKYNVGTDDGVLGFVALGVTLLANWTHLLAYRARFEASSVVHRLADMVEGIAAAAAAHNVAPNLEALENGQLRNVVGFCIMGRLVHVLRRVELVAVHAWGKAVDRDRDTLGAALRGLKLLVLETVCLVVCLFLPTPKAIFLGLLCTWALQALLAYAPLVLSSVRWCRPRSKGVPMHVEFTVHRLSELVMIILGEGILSLVLAESPGGLEDEDVLNCGHVCLPDHLTSAASFAAGFVLLAAFTYSYFRVNPFMRHHHAVRRNSLRGLTWYLLHSVLAVALVGIGVGIKSVHPLALEGTKPKYIALLCGNAAVAVGALALQQVMHPGFRAMWRAPGLRARRLGLFALKLALGGAFLCALSFPPKETRGAALMAYAAVVGAGVAATVAAEKTKAMERALWEKADAGASPKLARRAKSAPAKAADPAQPPVVSVAPKEDDLKAEPQNDDAPTEAHDVEAASTSSSEDEEMDGADVKSAEVAGMCLGTA